MREKNRENRHNIEVTKRNLIDVLDVPINQFVVDILKEANIVKELVSVFKAVGGWKLRPSPPN